MDSRNYEDVGAEKPLFGEATRKVTRCVRLSNNSFGDRSITPLT